MKKKLLSTTVLALTLACTTAGYAQQSQFIPEGKWRGIFSLNDGVEAPFNFEVQGKTAAQAKVYLLNAEERFEISRLKQEQDSLFIYFDQFDNELALKISGNTLKGVFRKQDGSGKPTPVSAEFNKTFRFAPVTQAPSTNITGKYDVVFKDNSGKDNNAVGIFTQTGNKLRGTFLKITGDSRYLDGVVDGNKFYLTSFIGSGITYLAGTINTNNNFNGELAGAIGNQSFTAVKNANAALPDAYRLTYLKDGYKTLDFSFPDVNGKQVSLKDDKYKNKVVILTITGSWCPNCVDEAAYLAPWFKKNKNRGIEAIAIHYERSTDPAHVKKVLGRFKQRYDIEYDQVIAGLADKKGVAASLPALNTFLSFPTILFIDRNGNVDKVYTGYNGPATGKYHDQYVKEFNDEIDKLAGPAGSDKSKKIVSK